MMRWIVRSSLRFRFLLVGVAGGLLFFGTSKLSHTPVDVFPEFAPPRVEIQTVCLGLSAAEVESLATIPLEQALNGVAHLDIMRSKSVSQLSSIELIFELGTDLITARQEVQERMAVIAPSLPTWAAPPFMMPPVSATSRVMKIGMTSDKYSLTDMSMISYWTIRARLLRVPGVANVAIWGERLKMPQVQVDPQLMKANDVSLDAVMEVTANALDAGLLRFADGARIGTGGFVETSNQRLGVRHILPITTPETLAQVPVVQRDGKTLRLGDIARVVEGHQPLIGDAVINDGPGLMLIVEKFPWGNTVDVTNGVQAALDDMKPGLKDITFDPSIFRPADFVKTAIDNLTHSLLLGVILVLVIHVLFLFEWRAALISILAIPLSLLAAGLVLTARGAAINTMTLAGFVIAVGVVVDDAIIDVENVVRRLRQNRRDGTGKSTWSIILDASVEVRSAIIYATLIDVVALVPVFMMQGLSGSFFQPLALSYGLAVLASLVVALTVTPALALILLGDTPIEKHESPVAKLVQRAYDRLVARTIRKPRAAFATVCLFLAVGGFVAPRLGQSLFPEFKERDFLMHWITKSGTSIEEENRIVTRGGKELRAVPGVQAFGSHIGQAFLADEVVGVNTGENWVSVAPDADYDETVDALQKVVDGYPGLQRDVTTYLTERIEEVLTGSSEAMVVRIFGNDLQVLRDKAEEVKHLFSSTKGVVDEFVEQQIDVPQIEVRVKLDVADRYGIKPGDVRRAAATLVAGEEVGDIFRAGKAYDVQVWSTPETRQSLDSIRALPIDTPKGGQVALSELADVDVKVTPNQVRHEGVSRSITVGANVDGRDLGEVAREIQDGLATRIDFPRGYHATLLGEYAERQATQKRLAAFGIASAIGVFLLLHAAFKSWRLAALSFLTLPAALVGGVLAAYMLEDRTISLGALVGFFTVLGIAARNGIMLINHYQHLEREEGEVFGAELVQRGTKERLRPILMTTLATALALVPLIVAGAIPGHEIEHPMAIVILGGLVTSTMLNLFVMPSLYLRFGKPKAPEAPAAQLSPGI
jgi:CzcA family heavy metal efflux pump